MVKTNPLTQALRQQDRKNGSALIRSDLVDVTSVNKTHLPKLPPSRVGRVLIGGHFAPEVQTELKVLAAQERTSIQSLIAEGIDAVFARRHKPQIATLSPLRTSTEE